ncbi:MAG: hypothetical protein AABW81_00775 [Nanoarchaeota archaeon]
MIKRGILTFAVLIVLVSFASANLIVQDKLSLRGDGITYFEINGTTPYPIIKPDANFKFVKASSDVFDKVYQSSGYFRTKFNNKDNLYIKLGQRKNNLNITQFDSSVIIGSADATITLRMNNKKETIKKFMINYNVNRINNTMTIESNDTELQFKIEFPYEVPISWTYEID